MDIKLEEYDFYIRPNVTDMRKGSTSLAYIVQNEMQLRPFDKAVFVFCGRSKKTIKAIVWDRSAIYTMKITHTELCCIPVKSTGRSSWEKEKKQA